MYDMTLTNTVDYTCTQDGGMQTLNIYILYVSSLEYCWFNIQVLTVARDKLLLILRYF